MSFFKGAMSLYFESFFATCKTNFHLKEITKYEQKNIKDVIINQEGTRMAKDGDD